MSTPRSVRRTIRRRNYEGYIGRASSPKLFFEHQFPAPTTSVTKKSKSRTATLMLGLGVLIFVVGLGATVHAVLTNRAATAQVAVLAERTTGPATDNGFPDTAKPSDDDLQNYKVAPDLPRYVEIPKLSVFGRVMPVGLNNKGELDTPKNVHDAAWYTSSAKPGERGATVIDGHVSSWTTPGIFYKLPTLSKGETIHITKGDGTKLTYQVEAVRTYSYDDVDMQEVMKPIDPSVPGLNIISCTGKVKPGTNEFDKRVVVFAKLKK